MSNTLRKLSPRQTAKLIFKHVNAGLVPYIKSSPGMGKSSIYKQLAKKLNLFPIDIRLSMYSPLDINGMPKTRPDGKKATFLPFDNFPLEGDPIPEGYDGFLIILDEYNTIPRSVEAAAYKILLDKYVGDKKLHPNSYIVLAGNLETDRAITNPTSTATKLRAHTIIMHIPPDREHVKEFLEDVAYPSGWPSIISAYLMYKPMHINTFKPDMVDETAAVPRTWEFAAKALMADPDDVRDLDFMSSILSYTVAAELKMFAETIDKLPSYESMMADPHGFDMANMPAAARYGLITSLIGNTSEKNIKTMMDILQRPELGIEFKGMYVRGLNSLYKSKFAMNEHLIDAQASIQEHLNVGVA